MERDKQVPLRASDLKTQPRFMLEILHKCFNIFMKFYTSVASIELQKMYSYHTLDKVEPNPT